jgi:hypothetical protein
MSMLRKLFGATRNRAHEKCIPVLPKNYRRIALYAISIAIEPIVLINRRTVTDFSESGPLTQKKLRGVIDFEVRDGSKPILGFHDHPDEMWITESYAHFAEHCSQQGWLKVQGPAS